MYDDLVSKFLQSKILTKSNGILSKKNGLPTYYKRIYNWKDKMTADLEESWKVFISGFPSEAEAWFCLVKQINPDDYRCPICGSHCMFQNNMYRSTCANHSPNQVDVKIEKVKQSLGKLDKNKIKEKREATNLTKYGVKHNWSSTNPDLNGKTGRLNKYGDENYNNKEKRRQTCLNKYGVNSNLFIPEVSAKARISSNSPEAKEKRKQTCLTRYGVENISQSKDFQQKSWNKKHLVIDNIEQQFNVTSYSKLVKQFGQGWLALNLPRIKISSYTFISNEYLPEIERYTSEIHKVTFSEGEKEVVQFIRSILPNVDIFENYKLDISEDELPYRELDVYIPSKNVAIEYNGVYWHSINASDKNRNLHILKTNMCNKRNIRLIHIFEDMWKSRQDICKSIIASALGIYEKRIYARKCIVKNIDSYTYRTFLNINHIQGEISSKEKYGLFYNNELVQVIGFGKSRYKDNEYELHRMCTKLNTQVIGGFSKLISHSNINNFISYIDISLYNGQGYEQVGFTPIHYSKPSHFYVKDLIRYNRIQFQKHKLKDKLDYFDPSKTEIENMILNKYLVLYDCGTLKVKYKTKNKY